MYATQRYTPSSPRTVSLGAAVAINGLLIAGLIGMVPNIIAKKPLPPLVVQPIPIDVPPPPNPEPKPKTEPLPQQPEIYLPPLPNPQPQQPVFRATDTIPTELPLIKPLDVPTGPATVIEKPVPLPPLIGAQQDPRYARDFQPVYPGSELRAQRDGQVSVRVLIGTDGRVKAVEQLSATTAAFFEATRRQALSKWRFKPATRGGVPQESWKTMNVRFRLEDA